MASPNHLLANEELVEQMDIKVNITHYPKVTLCIIGVIFNIKQNGDLSTIRLALSAGHEL